jgi:hypothetical protein
MSLTVSTTDPTSIAADRPAHRPRERAAWSPWPWMALTCVLLGASGGVRIWQDHRFATAQNRVEASPFPLKDLPRTFGDWHVQDGSEKDLDPEVAQIAGCSDSVIRTYINTITGVSVNVFVLFGPAQIVFGHRPEICYPSAGYRMVSDPALREIPIRSGSAALFRNEIFAREGEKRLRREEVLYSFRHGEQWSPDVERFWKDFRHHPSMFKIQMQRSVSEAEQHHELNNPSEQLLALLLPEIERRVAKAQQGREG